MQAAKFGSKGRFCKGHTTQTNGIEAQSTTSKQKASPARSKSLCTHQEDRITPRCITILMKNRNIVAAEYDYESEEGDEEVIRSCFSYRHMAMTSIR